MNSAKAISHEGVVTKADGNGVVEVCILTGTACSTCHAKSACGAGSGETKTVIIKTTREFKPGEKVIVNMEQSQGTLAVSLGYIIPFIVLIASFIIATVSGANELFSCLIAFGALGVYYFALWRLRGTIEKKFTFNIKY